MKPETGKAPGLTRRKNRDGSCTWYWSAARASRQAGDYEPRTVRLATGLSIEERAERCRTLTAEMLIHLASSGEWRSTFDGTLASLIRDYQTDPLGPYAAVKEITRRQDYDPSLKILERLAGARRIDRVSGRDFAAWYADFRKPAKPGEPERLRRAWGAMKMLRAVIAYGVTCRISACAAAAQILSHMEFEQPGAREQRLTYEQASAIVDMAIGRKLLSIAFAQALQFELSLRQSQVIGEWIKAGAVEGGIVFRGRRWQGLTWSNVSADMVLAFRTSKTGAQAEFALELYPLVAKVLALIPAERRVGPLIVSEATGRPYRANHFQKEWRALREACGISASIWNRDSRAGGITEGAEAGADAADLQRLATHADARTTGRYIRKTLESTNRVAELRAAARGKNKT